jgi:hypothetical protein
LQGFVHDFLRDWVNASAKIYPSCNRDLTAWADIRFDLLVVPCEFEKKPSLGISGGFFIGLPMNYQAFTNSSLTMMYEGIRGALAADDALEKEGREPPFRVRDTPNWKQHAVDLEAEMLGRGMIFEIIDWSFGQALPRLDE